MKRFILLLLMLTLAACTSSAPGTANSSASRSLAPSTDPSFTAGAWIIPHTPTGPALTGKPTSAVDNDDAFSLSITVKQNRYRAGQPIEVTAALTYLGPAEQTTVSGSGTGLVGFSIQRTSPPIVISAAGTTDCRSYLLARDESLAYPFSKSGGFSADDAQAAFYEAYFADEPLRLPAGEWTISAGGSFFSGGDCGEDLHELAASVTIIVEP